MERPLKWPLVLSEGLLLSGFGEESNNRPCFKCDFISRITARVSPYVRE